MKHFLSSTLVEQVVVMLANIMLSKLSLMLTTEGLTPLTAMLAFLSDFRDLSSLSMIACPLVYMIIRSPIIVLKESG